MKEKHTIRPSDLTNWLCALIILVLLVLMFMPFWNFDGQSVSVNSYIWFPEDHGALNSYFTASLGSSVYVNDVAFAPVFTFVMGAIFVALQAFFRRVPFAPVGAIVVGLVGMSGYLSSDVLRLGSSWGLHLAVCIIMLVVGVISLLLWIAEFIKRISK